MKRFVLAGAFCLLAVAAAAAPKAIGDCEKIADPDAYNRCLASFGPASRAGRGSSGGEGAAAPAPTAEPVQQVAAPRGRRGRGFLSRRGRGGGVARGRGGRVRMEINVGGARGGRFYTRKRRR